MRRQNHAANWMALENLNQKEKQNERNCIRHRQKDTIWEHCNIQGQWGCIIFSNVRNIEVQFDGQRLS